jgi:hypothetical protein
VGPEGYPISLVRITEEVFELIGSGFVLENRD